MKLSRFSNNGLVECVNYNGRELTYIIRASFLPNCTTFLTPPEFKQQVGYIVYRSGEEIARHVHRSLEHHLVATRELNTGDIILMVGGGHGFRILEDTVLLEIKQGPYAGLEEKERF